MYDGRENPAKSDLAPDRYGRRNAELAKELRSDWLQGKLEDSATQEMVDALRSASEEDCCRQVVSTINRGVSPQSIWDALYFVSCELVMRQPAIVPLHAVTSTNALRYAWMSAADDSTRRMILLQNAAFVAAFREAAKGRGQLKDGRLDALEAITANGKGVAAVEEIFAEVSAKPQAAAQKLLAYLKNDGDPKQVIDAARVLVFLKGSNAHDYKYSSAILEDYYNVSANWRDRCLAGGLFLLKGSGGGDNRLVERTRAALA
jgi:hypothetical protein